MVEIDIRSKVRKLIRELVNAVQIRSVYGPKHRMTKGAIDSLYSILSEILSREKEIIIGIIGSEIVFEKEPFYEISKYIQDFIKHLKEMKAEKITFLKGVQKGELADVVSILSMNPKSVKGAGGFEKLLDSARIRNIVFGKIGVRGRKGETAEEGINAMAKENFQNGIYFLKKASEAINENRTIDIKAARYFINSLISNLIENKYSLLILTSFKAHDEYSFTHSLNVAIFTLVQAAALGLEQDFLNDIGIAALLHDVGKQMIPGDILKKKGKLNEEDLQKIHMHSADGAKILLQTPDINLLAAITAFEHHMGYDMAGYPKKIFGERINLVSMMIEIADFYDATRSKRAYREEEEMASERSYEEMMNLSGKYFHPALLHNFFRIVGVYSSGTLVELDSKEIGLVVKQSVLDIRRPQVEILYNSKGEKEENPYIVNLLEKDVKSGDYKRTIVKSINPSDKFRVPEKYL